MFFYCLLGFSTGWFNSTGNTLLLQSHGKDSVGAWMHALHFSFGFGAFVSPLVIRLSMSQTLEGQGYAGAMISFGILSFIVAIFLLSMPTPEKEDQET